jgi:pyrroloquinoline quinone biosynthesis protein B
MELFAQMPDSLRRKVCFIHFNHTNPLLRRGSEAWKRVRSNGYGVAEEGMVVGL